jgi:hypothetical protein
MPLPHAAYAQVQTSLAKAWDAAEAAESSVDSDPETAHAYAALASAWASIAHAAKLNV